MSLSHLLAAGIVAISAHPAMQTTAQDDDPTDKGGNVVAEVTVSEAPEPPPPPPCYWTSKSATAGDMAHEKGFWQQIDGGDHYDDVLVFFEDGSLHRTFISTQKTYVLQVRICDDRDDADHGNIRWTVVGPPNPELLWEELSERVTRRVPLPQWELGMTPEADGTVRVVVNLGLWIAVTNSDDVVARAEPAPGVWAETRASLSGITFDPGNGARPIPCTGAGSPLPDDLGDTTEQGPCGYTYTTVDDLGEHTATVTATWTVTSTASTGSSETRPDIVLRTQIPIDVYEIQTVGTG